jgi:hypothetical protein
MDETKVNLAQYGTRCEDLHKNMSTHKWTPQMVVNIYCSLVMTLRSGLKFSLYHVLKPQMLLEFSTKKLYVDMAAHNQY